MMEHFLTQEKAPEAPAPRIACEEEAADYARLVVEPLEEGFGTTLGNALRRVLLRALPGVAVTAVRIEEVQHEFSTIPYAKEDTMEFLLNVREIRLRSLTDRPGRMTLEVRGEGRVCAGDIQTSADFEVVNPELHLITLDSPQAKLTVEFQVGLGRGYRPAEMSQGQPIGVIPVDAIFSPMKRVNYAVEHTRVGQATNYDKLTLEVWTDGSLTPVQAVTRGARILADQLGLFLDLEKALAPAQGKGPASTFLTEEQYQMPLEQLNLSSRTFNCLRRAGITMVGQVVEMSSQELLGLRNFGEKSMQEVQQRLAEMGLVPPESTAGEEPDAGALAGAEEAARET